MSRGLDWGMCMGPRGKQDPEAEVGAKEWRPRGQWVSRGCFVLLQEVVRKIKPGREGDGRVVSGTPTHDSDTEATPCFLGGGSNGACSVGKENGQVIYLGARPRWEAMLRNRADGREASENENGGRRRMVAAGLSTMDGRHGGTYPSCPLSPGQVSGRAAWAACPLRLIQEHSDGFLCERPY